jgi:hypothetical protein
MTDIVLRATIRPSTTHPSTSIPSLSRYIHHIASGNTCVSFQSLNTGVSIRHVVIRALYTSTHDRASCKHQWEDLLCGLDQDIKEVAIGQDNKGTSNAEIRTRARRQCESIWLLSTNRRGVSSFQVALPRARWILTLHI